MDSGRPNSTSAFADHVGQHRGLALLRALARADYTSNTEVLRTWLGAIGLACGQAELRVQIDSLVRQGLLEETWTEKVHVVKLTARGLEVSQGLLTSEGVLHPGPDCPY